MADRVKENRYRWLIVAAAVFLAVAAVCSAGTQQTSGITVQTTIDHARAVLNDSSTALVTDAQMVVWVNEASRYIAEQARCLESSITATLAAGTGAYSITENHYDVEAAYYYTGATTGFQYRFLDKVDPKTLRTEQYETGEPRVWYEWGGQINVWPIPAASEAGYSLTVLLISEPTAITTTTQTLETPYYFDTAYVDYLMAKYWIKDKKYDRAAYFMARFEAALMRYRQEIRRPLVTMEPRQ